MGKARHLSPFAEELASLFHVHSRCVGRAFKFGDDRQGAWIKNKFVSMMQEYEEILK